MVPHFITAQSSPITQLEQRMLDAMPGIEHWFRQQWLDHTPPFYSSVDIRNAGFKLAPVDTNLYPGGWNNLSTEMLPLAVQAAMGAIEKICPDAKKLLLIPENHTRNIAYFNNVAQLQRIFHQAGFHVRLGSINPQITEPTHYDLPDGQRLTIEPVVRRNGRLGLPDFAPCTVLLNNDLSAGVPEVLQGLNEQYVLPPLNAAWAVRRKSQHFQHYQQVAQEFAQWLDIDPWLINPLFSSCANLNFHEGTGIEDLSERVNTLLQDIARKFKEYGITEKPYVVVKADNGTYGMGIMTVHDAAEINALNRKTRNKMSVIKEGQEVSEVIIQEGVLTNERVNDAVAEPVVYMMDRYVVGGFYRVHASRGVDENLNAPGSHFVPLAFASSSPWTDPEAPPSSPPNRFYIYGVIARLAMLAASRELEVAA